MSQVIYVILIIFFYNSKRYIQRNRNSTGVYIIYRINIVDYFIYILCLSYNKRLSIESLRRK